MKCFITTNTDNRNQMTIKKQEAIMIITSKRKNYQCDTTSFSQACKHTCILQHFAWFQDSTANVLIDENV